MPHPLGVPNAASPATGADSPYTGDPQSRPGPGAGHYGVQGPQQNRPGMPPAMKGILPPQSPGMNPAKGPGAIQPKIEEGINSSPQTIAAVPGHLGQPPQLGPGPPGPSVPGGAMGAGPSTAPPTPSGPPSNMTTPSLNTTQPMSQGPPSASTMPPSTDMFSSDLMQNFNAFDGLEFGPSDASLGFGDVDFAQGLGEWFETNFTTGDLK